MKSNLTDISVFVVHETQSAVLVHDGDETKKVWLPKSQIEIERDAHKPHLATITLPEWLAIDKGFV